MFYVATARGFLIIPGKEKRYEFTPNPREATPFVEFDKADEIAKACVALCFHRRESYFSILDTCNGTKIEPPVQDDSVIDVEMIEVAELKRVME